MEEKESYQIAAKETLKKLVDDKMSYHVITRWIYMQSLMEEKESYQIAAKETLKKLVDDKVS